MPDLNTLISAIRQLRGIPPDMNEIRANVKLNEAGSVMGSDRQAQQLRGRNPTLAAVNDMIESLNPINWMGGFGGTGAAFAPIRTAAQKQIVKAAYRVAPDLVKEAQDLPQMLKVDVGRLPGSEAGYSGVPSGYFRGSTGDLRIDPSVMRGQVPQNKLTQAFADAIAAISGGPAASLFKTGKTSDLGNLPQVAAHEMQHFVNKNKILPQLTQGNEGPASIAARISRALPGESGAGQVADLFKAGNKVAAIDEALAYLREASIRNPNDPLVQALRGEFLGK